MGTFAFDAARWTGILRRPLEREMLVYFVASLLDVFLTYVLIYGNGPWVIVEGNPIAGYFLHQTGFAGMVVFKTALVLVVAMNCLIIARSRPNVALKLIRFADLAVLTVVAYSTFLLWQFA